MSVIEPLSVISYLRKDYEKNLEDSSIYKKFEKDLPAFDTKAFLFDLKNFSNSGIFYVRLMKMANCFILDGFSKSEVGTSLICGFAKDGCLFK